MRSETSMRTETSSNKGKLGGALYYVKIKFDELAFREVFGSLSVNAP